MPIRMHGPARIRRPIGARVAFAAAAACVAWLVGSAIAQESAIEAQVPDLRPENLFGGQPETPSETPAPAPVLDPANPDHHKLQVPQEALGALPVDGRGKPDWVRALREGLIQPRAGVAGGPGLPLLDLDVLMKNTAQMPYVKFPHGTHTAWLACSNCHDGLFVAKAGANPTTMSKILQGESCGVCHTKVAFTAMFTCERCHSVPQPGQQRWW